MCMCRRNMGIRVLILLLAMCSFANASDLTKEEKECMDKLKHDINLEQGEFFYCISGARKLADGKEKDKFLKDFIKGKYK